MVLKSVHAAKRDSFLESVSTKNEVFFIATLAMKTGEMYKLFQEAAFVVNFTIVTLDHDRIERQ